jgi:hypothetical protein
VSILSTPTTAIHVAPPRDSIEDASPKTRSNPFEGRLLDFESPVVAGESHEFTFHFAKVSTEVPSSGERESHEILDEINFNSPNLRNGRAGSMGQFAFQDHDDDDEDYDNGKITQTSPTNSKYATVAIIENHGLDEDDAFLDEKRKPQPTNFGTFTSAITPHRLRHGLRALHDKYPRSTKAAIIVLLALVPLFIVAFLILVIVTLTGFQAPTVFMGNSLDTSALEAGSWGFNFTRAMNLTIINKSPMTIDVQKIDIDVDLARSVGHFTVLSSLRPFLILGKWKCRSRFHTWTEGRFHHLYPSDEVHV